MEGPGAFDADPVLRFAAEAVVGRIGDAASKLSDETMDRDQRSAVTRDHAACGTSSLTRTTG